MSEEYKREDFPEFNATVFTLAKDNIPYLDEPTQCKFWDIFGTVGGYIGGIAYRNFVISGKTGEAIQIAEIYVSAPSNRKPLILYNDWISLDTQLRLGDYMVNK